MKYLLTDYQDVASETVSRYIRSAQMDYQENNEHWAVSLSAPTGSGKTIIATSVIERLFVGDDVAAPNKEAVVIWLTDAPALNRQTMRKMLMSSNKLMPSQLVEIDQTFDQEVFTTNTVYFLNIQKLSKSSSYVQSKTDSRRYSLWESVENSIKAFGGNLLLIIDEAHRGTGSVSRDKPTIVSRFITRNEGSIAPVPVIWGISATPERFLDYVGNANNPGRSLRQHNVKPEDVRESGLIKDYLDIRHPNGVKQADSTLTKLATTMLKATTKRWNTYTEANHLPSVEPALVVQVPSDPDETWFDSVLASIQEEWPEIKDINFAHTFGENSTIHVGNRTIRYVNPEDIQDDKSIKVVLFKQALTTGWDCPRAEILISFFKANDPTYIAQLVGRMVRTPLAKRITSDDALNRVSLFLPNYDQDHLSAIIQYLQSDSDSAPIEILENASDYNANESLGFDSRGVLESIPTYTKPTISKKSQVARVHQLAHLLEGDGFYEDAMRVCDEQLLAVIDRYRTSLVSEGKYDQALASVSTMAVGSVSIELASGELTGGVESTQIAHRHLNQLFRNAKKGLPDGLSVAYWSWLLDQPGYLLAPDESKQLVIYLAQEPSLLTELELLSEKLVTDWLIKFDSLIRELPESMQANYRRVKSLAKQAEQTTLFAPAFISSGANSKSSTLKKHIYADSNGDYLAVLNDWEAKTLAEELTSPKTLGWYRNPSKTDRAIAIPYADSNKETVFYPDFIFFHEIDGAVLPSIIDPHSYALADSAPKLRGLAAYAAKHSEAFHRIDAVIVLDNQLLRLDMTRSEVQDASLPVTSGIDVTDLFKKFGSSYLPG